MHWLGELGKMEGLLEAARVVDRGVEVAGGGSGQSRDSLRTGSRVVWQRWPKGRWSEKAER